MPWTQRTPRASFIATSNLPISSSPNADTPTSSTSDSPNFSCPLLRLRFLPRQAPPWKIPPSTSPAPEPRSEQSLTCLQSRPLARSWTLALIFFPLELCSTRWPPDNCRSGEIPLPLFSVPFFTAHRSHLCV